MSIALIVIIVLLVLLVVGGVVYAVMRRRRETLQERFSGEYDRTVEETGSRRDAERELLARQKRHDQLDIKPLAPKQSAAYAARWEAAQTTFVDEPQAALVDADTLIQSVMSDRGYPTGNFDTQVEDLSVEHADVLQHYRAAHAITAASERQQADTEQMRRAMQHYRELFQALLDDTPRQRTDEPNHTGGRR